MLAAKNFVDALTREDETETYTDSNNDYNFSDVLGLYKSEESLSKHKIRYSDGQERCFSFDDLGE